jgi:hypothetical protein
MIDDLSLLKGLGFKLNDKITLKHPTLNDIIEFGEENYFRIVHLFCTQPHDAMVFLDDIGVDYEQIDAYDLFIMMFQSYNYSNELKWFMGIDDFLLCQNNQNQMLCLYNKQNDFVLDKLSYHQIADYIRKINFINPQYKFNPANSITKKKIIEQERKKLKRQKNKEFKSVFKNQVSALVWGNTSGVNYTNVWDLYVYQINDGLMRLNKIKNYDKVMNGYYFGTVDLKQLNKEEIDWLSDI